MRLSFSAARRYHGGRINFDSPGTGQRMQEHIRFVSIDDRGCLVVRTEEGGELSMSAEGWKKGARGTVKQATRGRPTILFPKARQRARRKVSL